MKKNDVRATAPLEEGIVPDPVGLVQTRFRTVRHAQRDGSRDRPVNAADGEPITCRGDRGHKPTPVVMPIA